MEPSSIQRLIKSDFEDSVQDIPDLILFKDIKQEVVDGDVFKLTDPDPTDDLTEEYTTTCEKMSSNQAEPLVEGIMEVTEEINKSGEMYEINLRDEKIRIELDTRNEVPKSNETSILSGNKGQNTLTIHKCQQSPSTNKQKCQKLQNLEVKVFKCEQCAFQSIRRGNLNKHLLQHKKPEDTKLFKCDHCDYQSLYKYSLQKHSFLHKNQEEVTVFKCGQCDYKTIQKVYLNQHLLRHKNPEEVNRFKCDQCQYQTVYKGHLKSHLRRHKNPEEVHMFKCDHCEYQTIYKSHMNTHVVRHKNPAEVSVFKCDQCDFQSIFKRYLTKHLFRHRTPEKWVEVKKV